MSFRHDPLGALVSQDPAAAHARLTKLFQRHRELKAVASHLGVAGSTVTRWITRLTAGGHQDPRISAGVATFAMLIDDNPSEAHARLCELFAAHRQQKRVAEELGVQSSSVTRWIAELSAAGYADPRPSRAA